MPADGGQVAHVAIAERAGIAARADTRGDCACDMTAGLLGGRRDARHRLAVPGVDQRGVADDEHPVQARHAQILAHGHAPGPVGVHAQPARHRRGGHARRPNDGGTGQRLAVDDHAGVGHILHRLADHHLHPQLFQRAPGVGRQPFGEGAQQAVAGLDQDDARALGVDVAEVGGQRLVRQFGDGPGHFHTGRPAADDHEVQVAALFVRMAGDLGALEGDQDALAHLGGVDDALQPRGEGRPGVLAEIAVLGTGGQDQEVIVDRAGGIREHLPGPRVDAGDLGQQDRRVALLGKNTADGPGDVGRRQVGGRHLIQQRLEQVVVALVDDDHVDRRVPQLLGRRQAAEAGADDDHTRSAAMGLLKVADPCHASGPRSRGRSLLSDKPDQRPYNRRRA